MILNEIEVQPSRAPTTVHSASPRPIAAWTQDAVGPTPPHVTLYADLRRQVNLRADAAAFRAKRRGRWRTWTWAQTEREVDLAHRILIRIGVEGGAMVGISGECNCRLYWYVLAAQRAGATPVLVSSRSTLDEMRACQEQTGFGVLVVATDRLALAASQLVADSRLDTVLTLDGSMVTNDPMHGVISEQRIIDEVEAEPRSAAVPIVPGGAVLLPDYDAEGTLGYILYPPEGLAAAADRLVSLLGLNARDEVVSFLPTSWIGDFLQFAAALRVGATLSTVESAATVRQDLRRLAPHVIVAPASFYRRLLTQIEADIARSSWLTQRLYRGAARGAMPRRRGLVDVVFTAPLRNVTGLSRCRQALCATDTASPSLVAGFAGLGVTLEETLMAARFGGAVTRKTSATARGLDLGKPVDGVELRIGPADALHMRSAAPVAAWGHREASLESERTSDGRWMPTGLSGALDLAGTLTLTPMRAASGVESSTVAIMNERLGAIRGDRLVRHALLKPDGHGGWIVAIDPDLDALRAISPDPGAVYADLVRDPIVKAAFDRIILGREGPVGTTARAAPITGFAFFAEPLARGNGALTPDGTLKGDRVGAMLAEADVASFPLEPGLVGPKPQGAKR